MSPMAVRPMATPTSTRRRVGSATAARAGESGCSKRVTKTQAEIMKTPRQAASIAYSGQWRVTAPPAPSRTGSRRSCLRSRPRGRAAARAPASRPLGADLIALAVEALDPGADADGAGVLAGAARRARRLRSIVFLRREV